MLPPPLPTLPLGGPWRSRGHQLPIVRLFALPRGADRGSKLVHAFQSGSHARGKRKTQSTCLRLTQGHGDAVLHKISDHRSSPELNRRARQFPCLELCGPTNGRYISDGAQPVEIVRPYLHHLASLDEARRPIVRSADLVPLLVSQLKLDHVGREALFVQQCARHTAEAVTGLLFARVSKPS